MNIYNWYSWYMLANLIYNYSTCKLELRKYTIFNSLINKERFLHIHIYIYTYMDNISILSLKKHQNPLNNWGHHLAGCPKCLWLLGQRYSYWKVMCTCYVLYLPNGSKRNDSYPGWNNRGEALPLESLKLQNPFPNAKKKAEPRLPFSRKCLNMQPWKTDHL